MPKLVVGAAIVDSLTRPTRLLAAQRSYPENLAGLWEFPGGKVEPGETSEAALRREISEELSTSLVLGARVSSNDDGDWPLPNGSNIRIHPSVLLYCWQTFIHWEPFQHIASNKDPSVQAFTLQRSITSQ